MANGITASIRKESDVPHQDKGRDSLPAYNHQALRESLDWLLSKVTLSSVEFRKDCRWSVRSLIVTALLWVWSDEKTLTDRFATARKIVQRVLHLSEEPASSYQAFTKMLRRWTAPLLLLLASAFRQRMKQDLSRRFRIGGWVVFAGDGSRMELPRTVSNEQRFSAGSRPAAETSDGPAVPAGKKPKPKRKAKPKKKARGDLRKAQRRRARKRRQAARARKKKPAGPQMWLTVLWHVGTQLPWDWRTGPSDSSERDHLLQMLSGLPKGALITADAGFVGYAFWNAVLKSGRQFLIRVGSNVRLLKNLGYAKEKNGLVYLWPDEAASKGQPPLVLRLIVVHNGKEPVYLVTSVLDEQALSDKQVVEIYRMRWGIEVFYRHFKQTFERRKLRSQSADNAQVEAAWSLLGLWAMALHSQWKLAQAGIPVQRVSVAGVLRAYRKSMREYKSRPDPGEDLWSLLDDAVIDEYKRASKASRDYPRKKYDPPIGAPEIVTATREQKARAKKIKRDIALGLTA
jgi:hypothetical protein